ncbi:MAG: hypothetical protein ACRDJV_11545 [Actinomycetota bacterium]
MTRRRRVTVAAAAGALALSLACGPDAPTSSPGPGFEPRLVTMPSAIVEKCRRKKALKRACPVKVPSVKPGAFQHVTAPRRIWPVFSAEWNAPYPKLTERNAPPRSAHLVVHAEHRHMFPFKWPTELPLQDSPIEDKRKEALLMGTPTWGGLRGSLVLAPSYPYGGIDGDHLVFRWEEEGSTYAVSLHAWRPLDESILTLKAVVESLP